MSELQIRALMATAKYLRAKGYDVVESDFEGHLVAWDDDVLVFVAVTPSMDELPELGGCREKFERVALDYLTENAESCTVRFDKVDLRVIGGDRALLRHHVNCLEL